PSLPSLGSGQPDYTLPWSSDVGIGLGVVVDAVLPGAAAAIRVLVCAEDVQRPTSAVVLGAPLLDVEEPGQRDFVGNLERRRERHVVHGVWIAMDADPGTCVRQ